MPKKIIFCSDGTWNHPQQSKPDPIRPKLNTNVAKLADQARLDGTVDPGCFPNTPTQTVIYDDGVGVEFPEFLGGAFGVGLFGKIKQAYAQIAEVYEQGDRLFLFGFSRGAYTARAFAGLLSLIGLPTTLPGADRKAAAREAAEKAFFAYFDQINRKHLVDAMASYQLEIPTIAMQGMWDTVGSLGFTGALFGWKDPAVYGFLDTDLHPNTEAAFHAMAIDEHRGEFAMTPWPGTARAGQVLKQVWFAGVHSEVGGSAPAVGLSDITLGWMLRNAEACGAELSPVADPYRNQDPQKALDPSTDSFNPLWVVSRRRPIPSDATIANSVVICLENDLTYNPSNLSLDGNRNLAPGYTLETVIAPLAAGGIVIPSNSVQFDTGFDLVAGKQYRFVATGEWIDKAPPPVGPAGVVDPGGIRHLMDHLKRVPLAPWMALLGRVGTGAWFVIGDDPRPRTLPAGRLYCCANDVPAFYFNNRGSVQLHIEQV